MSVQAEPYQLRFISSRFSVGAQEIRLKANRIESIMMELVQSSWKGAGAHAFAVKCELMKSQLLKTAEVLDHAANTLNRFASQMERVNQLRQQANILEQQSWQCSGDSIDDLHHRQNLARQVAQIRQEAEWEANAADAQAVNEFQTILTMIPQLLDQLNQFAGSHVGSGELDDLPEPMRSYYLRHRDLLEYEPDTSALPPNFAQMKQDDETYIQEHNTLLEAFRQYYLAKKADYLKTETQEEAVDFDMKYLPELTNEQLYNRLEDLMSKDEQAQYYMKLVQQPNFDAKVAWNKDSGYRQFVSINLGQAENPAAGFLSSGMVFAAGIMKALSPKYGRESGNASAGNVAKSQNIESNGNSDENEASSVPDHTTNDEHETGDDFVGTLKGEAVQLKGVKTREIVYTKRPPEETANLRKEFNNSVRKNFLKNFANDPERVKQLQKAGLTDRDLAKMRDGYVPTGWQVHHKVPLDDGGTNSLDNLVLIKNDPYHKAITNAQNDLTRGLLPGESKSINWPIPDGDIYPQEMDH